MELHLLKLSDNEADIRYSLWSAYHSILNARPSELLAVKAVQIAEVEEWC